MNDFWKWFKTFFDDHTSGASIIRLAFIMWMLFLCGWCSYVDIRTKELKPIPEGYIYITGLLAAAKVGQRIWGERDSSTVEITDPTTGKITTTTISGQSFMAAPSGSLSI